MATHFDLKLFADRLRDQAPHRRLVGTLDRWLDRNSRLADLDHAQQLLAHIVTVRSSRKQVSQLSAAPSFAPDVEGALFAHAVLLYAKAAADRDGGRRYGLGIPQLIPKPLLAIHQELLNLRNTTIAHVDDEGRQTWNRDRIILVERQAGDWEYGFPSSRTSLSSRLVRGFQALLADLVPRLSEMLRAENDHVHETLSVAVQTHASVRSELRSCEFDISEFYGGALTEDQFHKIIEEPGARWMAAVDLPPRAE